MSPIRVAIAGVGNCASALVQGLTYYKRQAEMPGLMTQSVEGYSIQDIQVVAAFDIDERKVGRLLHEAIFAEPNCTQIFERAVYPSDVVVQMAPLLDGVAPHMTCSHRCSDGHRGFRVSKRAPVDLGQVLSDSLCEVLVCLLPVGSQQAVHHLARVCLDTRVALVNCIPEFVASDPAWAEKFQTAKIPIIGDDIKSQAGATLINQALFKALASRGVRITKCYQLNVGGNSDFHNMQDPLRLASKRESKVEAVQSILPSKLPNDALHVGPSDYVHWLDDQKVAFIRIEWEGFGGVLMHSDLRLSVEDSPNSAAVIVEAICHAKVALDRGEGGALSVSHHLMKHPPKLGRG